ncbi:MAG: hypothetical protein EXR99_01435 [Gemmataceae bacterium]|nr:hypothetical protein [Gemmataceae bacterium]
MSEFRLRELPFPARLVLTVTLMSVLTGYVSALVNLHFQAASPGQTLPGVSETVVQYHGQENVTQLEKLLVSHEGKPFNGQGSMRSVFTKKRAGGITSGIRAKRKHLEEQAQAKLKNDPEALEKELKKIADDRHVEFYVLKELDGERVALVSWIRDGAKKEYYDNSSTAGFPLTGQLAGLEITPKFLNQSDDGKTKHANIQGIFETRCVRCHESNAGGPASVYPLASYEEIADYCDPAESSARSLDKLALSTHVHMLGFSMLYGITGLCLSLTSYSKWVRLILAPSALILQVVEIACWWLARLDSPAGPFFAFLITALGGAVALCLILQVLLTLWDIHSPSGRKVLILIILGLGIVAGLLAWKVALPYLDREKGINSIQTD